MKRLFLTLLLLVSMAPVAIAQTDLPDDKKAIFCFDVQVDKILNSKLAETLGPEMIDQMSQGMESPVPIQKYVRIFGMMGAPNSIQDMIFDGPNEKKEVMEDGFPVEKDMEEFEMPKQPDLPLNMFFEFQMVDAESARELLDMMQLDKNSAREIDGVEYLSPPPFAPQNIIAGITNETRVVMGTKDYVLASNRMDLFSDELFKAFERHQADLPIRASLEMISKADLIAEAVEMGGQGAPPFMAPMLGLVDNFESLNLAVDLSGPELLALRGIGKSDTDAEELRGGLNGLLGMAKLAGGGIDAQLQGTPAAAAMVKGMMNDLNTSGEGREVNIIIGRPENMEVAVNELMVMAQAQAKIAMRQNNMRQNMLAILNYESTNQAFPFEADESEPSWRVRIEPFLFNLKEGSMPESFGSDGENSMVAHVRTEKLVQTYADITDGASNTICLVEVKQGIPWKSNQDVSPEQVVEMVQGLAEGEVIVAARYDASIMILSADSDLEMIKKMCTPAGGEVVEDRWDEENFGPDFGRNAADFGGPADAGSGSGRKE